jgi:hypothetical protein
MTTMEVALKTFMFSVEHSLTDKQRREISDALRTSKIYANFKTRKPCIMDIYDFYSKQFIS